MENQRLKFLQSFIGKHFTESPSPFSHWLNVKVISVEEKSIEFQFLVRKDMTNPVGMLHGGVSSGMIDDCVGINFFILALDYFYPTINLNVEFFNPAFEGETVVVKTQVVKQGKTIINIKADVINETTQKLVAQATSNLVVGSIKIQL
jgi:acyl-coenzyme A thioesterase 13